MESEGGGDDSIFGLQGGTFSCVAQDMRGRGGEKRGDGLNRGSLLGRLLFRAPSFAVVENGEVLDVNWVCLATGMAERVTGLSREIIGTRRAVARDFRAGKSFIVI